MVKKLDLFEKVRVREYLEAEYAREGELALKVAIDTFHDVLRELQDKGQSGAFNGYSLGITAEPIVLKKSRVRIRAVKYSITIQSPNPDFNLFDLLDAGRPEPLPARPPGMPYPLWDVREPLLVRRRRSGTQFAQESRRRLSNPRGSDEGPGRFTQGPIPPIAPLNLYKRVFDLVRADLKRYGFKSWEVIQTKKRE